MDSGGPATEDPKCKRAIAWNRVGKVTAKIVSLRRKYDAAIVKLQAERARLSGIAGNTPCTCLEDELDKEREKRNEIVRMMRAKAKTRKTTRGARDGYRPKERANG